MMHAEDTIGGNFATEKMSLNKWVYVSTNSMLCRLPGILNRGGMKRKEQYLNFK